MSRRHRWAAALAVAATAAGLAGCGSGSSSPAASSSPPPLHGAVPSDAMPKPDFVLTDTSGKTFRFASDTVGKVVLAYFGYTHCPDECPTAMADVATALRKVAPSVRSQVVVVFVTTDPRRDSRPVLRKWLDGFDPSFIGLTGTPAQIVRAEDAMQVPLAKPEAAPKGYGAGKYAVTHFAAVIAYDREGRVATLYPSGITPAEIAADLPVLAKE